MLATSALYLLTLVIIVACVIICQNFVVKFFKKSDKSQGSGYDSQINSTITNYADNLIHSATKKAETMISAAEIEAIKIAAQSRIGTKLFEQEYLERIDRALDNSEKKVDQYLVKSEQSFKEYLAKLQQFSINSQKNLEDSVKTQISQILFKFEENLSSFIASTEQKSTEAINLELQSARTLIDQYKAQQLILIDENIVAVLERTLNLVVKNKLSLKDQLDLVYEALEKAKIEKFFS